MAAYGKSSLTIWSDGQRNLAPPTLALGPPGADEGQGAGLRASQGCVFGAAISGKEAFSFFLLLHRGCCLRSSSAPFWPFYRFVVFLIHSVLFFFFTC